MCVWLIVMRWLINCLQVSPKVCEFFSVSRIIPSLYIRDRCVIVLCSLCISSCPQFHATHSLICGVEMWKEKITTPIHNVNHIHSPPHTRTYILSTQLLSCWWWVIVERYIYLPERIELISHRPVLDKRLVFTFYDVNRKEGLSRRRFVAKRSLVVGSQTFLIHINHW